MTWKKLLLAAGVTAAGIVCSSHLAAQAGTIKIGVLH
jgi:hypothetical protein